MAAPHGIPNPDPSHPPNPRMLQPSRREAWKGGMRDWGMDAPGRVECELVSLLRWLARLVQYSTVLSACCCLSAGHLQQRIARSFVPCIYLSPLEEVDCAPNSFRELLVASMCRCPVCTSARNWHCHQPHFSSMARCSSPISMMMVLLLHSLVCLV